MKKFKLLFLTVCIALPMFSQVRGKIDIPDLKGYVTLKCDFHLHTVFSDGRVWPTERVTEAYNEGLDAIAITDHHTVFNPLGDMVTTYNLSFVAAEAAAKAKGIILIRGIEISSATPPFHNNAIFLSDADALVHRDVMNSFRAAKEQNAFIFWCHPGWVRHQPDTTRWWPIHTQLLEEGMMHGLEVVNDADYYPEVHRWCLEKNLTMLGCTDAHGYMQTPSANYRNMTLVFARSATAEDIHEALKERRTAVYHEKYVIGEEKYLRELFENALEWKVQKAEARTIGKERRPYQQVNITVTNKSDLTFYLKKTDDHDPRIIYLRNTIAPVTIAPKGVSTITAILLDGLQGGDVNLIVENFFVQPNQGMRHTVKIEN